MARAKKTAKNKNEEPKYSLSKKIKRRANSPKGENQMKSQNGFLIKEKPSTHIY